MTNNINIEQVVNKVTISSPGPQGPIGIADPSSSVSYARLSASTLQTTFASLTVLSDATINGVKVGKGPSDGLGDIAIGSGAFETSPLATVSDTGNIAIGRNAQYALQTVDYGANVAIGDSALTSASDSYSNTAVGYYSIAALQSGYSNNALGNLSLPSLIEGDENTSIGDSSLNSLVLGNQNVVVGNSVGSGTASGDGNVYIGYNSARNSSGVNAANKNIVIGYEAGPATPTSLLENKLYIDNSRTDNPLIYGDFATDKLIFNASVNTTGVLIAGQIQDTPIRTSSVVATTEGSIYYDNLVHHSLNLITDTATPQELGQQLLARVINGASDNTTLTKGTIVYLSGATGNRPRIDRAKADGLNTHDVLGIVYDDIIHNAEGFVLLSGVIDNVNTNNGTYTAGDTLYLSATTAGAYTNVAPSYPNYKVELGKVARANVANGRILFYVNPAYNANTASGNMLFSDGYRAIGSSSARIDYYGNASFTGNVLVGGLLKGLDGLTTTNSASIGNNLYVAGTISGITASSNISSSAIISSSALLANNSASLGGIVSSSYAGLNSPTFVGIPTAPTAASGTNTTQLATTQFVRTEVTNLINSAPSTLDTLKELADAIGDDPNFAVTVANTVSTASLNAYNQAVTYANSASSNAYNSASLFTRNASAGLFSFTVTASNGLFSYTNSASLNAYNQSSAFTQTASNGLFNLITNASAGIISSGSVQYSTISSSATNIYGSNAIFNQNGQLISGSNTGLSASTVAGSAAMISIIATSSINPGIIIRSASLVTAPHLEIQRSDGVDIFNIDSLGRMVWNANISGPAIRLGTTTILSTPGSPNSLVAIAYATNRNAFVTRGQVGQTADLFQVQTNGGSALAVFNKDGYLVLGSFSGSTTPQTSFVSGGLPGSAYLTIYQNASANTGIIFKRNNSSAQARAIEIQDQSNSVAAQIDAFGAMALRTTTIAADGAGATQTTFTAAKGNPGFRAMVLVSPSASTTSAVFEIQGGLSGNASQVFSISTLGQISSGSGYQSIFGSSAMLSIFNTFANGQGIIIRGATSQSANLQEWQNSTAASVVAIDPIGNITTSASITASAVTTPSAYQATNKPYVYVTNQNFPKMAVGSAAFNTFMTAGTPASAVIDYSAAAFTTRPFITFSISASLSAINVLAAGAIVAQTLGSSSALVQAATNTGSAYNPVLFWHAVGI